MAYTITVPKDMKWQPERAARFIEHVLTSMQGTAILRIVADHEAIRWEMIDYLVEFENTEGMIKGLRTIYPEADVTVSDYVPPPFTGPFTRALVPFVLAGELRDKNESVIAALSRKSGLNWVLPTRYVEDTQTNDPLMAVVQGMGGDLKPGSRATLTICATGFTDLKTRKKGQDALKASNINWFNVGMNMTSAGGVIGTFIGLGVGALTGGLKRDRFNEKDQKLAETKPNMEALWNTFVTLQVDVEDESDLANALHSTTALLHGYRTDYNWFDTLPATTRLIENAEQDEATTAFGLVRRMNANAAERQKYTCILSSHEIAALFHLPHNEFKTPDIVWSDAAKPSQAVLKNDRGAIIGTSGQAEVHLPHEDRRTHVNIVGKNGTGKSTLMHNLIHQDILEGKAVCVVDPHGRLVRDILRCSVPDQRMDDVVLIDVANADHPPPLNPLAIPDEHGQIGIGQVMGIIDKIYGEPATASRWTDAMQSALSTLRFEQTPTVRDVSRLFTDTEYRLTLLRDHQDHLDEASYEFWDRYNALQSEARKDELSYPIVHRMRSFYSSQTLYPIMCHPDVLDLRSLIASKKIILMSLKTDEAKIPDRERYLLGAVLVSQVEMTARRFGEKGNFALYAYIDEAQRLVATPLDKMLAEIRKFGVHLTITNQFFEQFEKPTLEALLGNTGATIAFQLGTHDADRLDPYFKPEVTADDLVKLSQYQAAVKMRLFGATQPAFKIRTLPPPPEPKDADGREAHIRRRSCELYTPRTRDEIMDWLKNRYPRRGFDGPPTGTASKPGPGTAPGSDPGSPPGPGTASAKKKGKGKGKASTDGWVVPPEDSK